ncbi:hypothetical protein ZWY2020_020727 [Hordeum vulgare]|nr:hypothetical protein ZWY2020_020727 [Hordeum vulgare]
MVDPAPASTPEEKVRELVGRASASTREVVGVPIGAGFDRGIFNARDWRDLRARSKRILRRATDREGCLERSKRRGREICNSLAEFRKRVGK